MNTFSRTASGISNYHRFHGADFMVFVEGKSPVQAADSEKRVDVYYYEYLLTAATLGKKPKVKCIGNKDAAFEYARKIREGGVAKSVVIVDKDFEGLLSSPIPVFPVIRTFGYSWENELWSVNTVAAVLRDLTNSEEGTPEIQRHLPNLGRRLKKVCMLDAAMQPSSSALLKKSSSLCGVGFTYPGITANEISRLANIFRNSASAACPIARDLIKGCSTFDPREVIQGHFWSNMVMRFTAALYKKIAKESSPTNAMLTNLALSHMRRDVSGAVGTDLVARYSAELARVGIQITSSHIAAPT